MSVFLLYNLIFFLEGGHLGCGIFLVGFCSCFSRNQFWGGVEILKLLITQESEENLSVRLFAVVVFFSFRGGWAVGERDDLEKSCQCRHGFSIILKSSEMAVNK